MRPAVPDEAPEFVKSVLGPMIVFHGDDLPTSLYFIMLGSEHRSYRQK